MRDGSRDVREGALVTGWIGETSGVLLAARTRPAWEALRAALGDPDGEKTYVAHVLGAPAAQGEFTGAIGRVGRSGARVSVDGGRQPLPARTRWEVMAVGPGPSALVRARLFAGRAHQVRRTWPRPATPSWVTSSMPTTARGRGRQALGVAGLRLHAESVRLRHPVTGAPLVHPRAAAGLGGGFCCRRAGR